MTVTPSEHLAAFMSGFEFVLLGFEGRLHAADLDEEAEAAVRAFIADYKALLKEYREGEQSEQRVVRIPDLPVSLN